MPETKPQTVPEQAPPVPAPPPDPTPARRQRHPSRPLQSWRRPRPFRSRPAGSGLRNLQPLTLPDRRRNLADPGAATAAADRDRAATNPEPPAPTVAQPQPTPVANAPGSPLPAPLNPIVAGPPANGSPPQPTVTIVPTSAAGGPGATLAPPRGSTVPLAPDPFTAPARPAAPPQPKTQSYLEEQHRWKAGDSFAAISTQYYATDKYAMALQSYNQDYPLATPAMRQNPPAIVPGQVIWVPPARILERDYGQQIGGLTPVKGSVPASDSRAGTPTGRSAVEAVPPPAGLANSGFGNSAGQLYPRPSAGRVGAGDRPADAWDQRSGWSRPGPESDAQPGPTAADPGRDSAAVAGGARVDGADRP